MLVGLPSAYSPKSWPVYPHHALAAERHLSTCCAQVSHNALARQARVELQGFYKRSIAVDFPRSRRRSR